jgi:Spy/CpxP family protein refolding chaperone
MKKIVTLTLAIGLVSTLIADANIPMDQKAIKAKITKMAGEVSPFNKNENFPKDYFLIPKNLPFALGLVLHHPQSSTLGLSKEQIEKLVKMKKEAQPSIIKESKEIKKMELSLLTLLESNEGNRTKITKEMSELVDTIAKRKAELTKAHLQCVIDVQNVLTKEQRKKAGSLVKSSNSAKTDNTKKEKLIVNYIKNPEIQSKGLKQIKGLIDTVKPSLMETLKKDKTGVDGTVMCSTSAPEMGANYNKTLPKDSSIRRTAIKYRNPNNKPDATDLVVMQDMIADGNLSKPLVVDMGDNFRVYKALPMHKPCLVCHGNLENMPTKMKDIVNKKYPNDLATGFKEHEFRGVIVSEIKK